MRLKAQDGILGGGLGARGRAAAARRRRDDSAGARPGAMRLPRDRGLPRANPLATQPPSVPEVVAITGATYASVYRWMTGRSRFPLEQFLRVVLARGADLPTATAWAERWLGVSVAGAEDDEN